MTGDANVSTSPELPGNQLAPRLCQCGCGRQATKASDYCWSYWCDPGVSAEAKLAARRLGGRRGQMTPAEAAKLFAQLEPGSAESRTNFRLRLMELHAVGRLTGSMYRDLLAGLDGMGKDQAKAPPPPATPLVVEVARFGAVNGTEARE